MIVEPIAYIRSTRKDTDDDDWDREISSIILEESFSADALAGLTDFTHIEVIYYFHKVNPSKITTDARHPRNNTDWPKVGIFSQRGKNRPNRLACTICKIENIMDKQISVSGMDAIDGTPVLDIKPVMKEFLPRGCVIQPAWSREIMSGYWKRPPK